jgi:serine phosphatase RsbU (regulator of sigma subunit)
MSTSASLHDAAVARKEQVHVLLVEDDDGDALLVEELLHDVQAPITLQRARSVTEACGLLLGAACVLLDLGLPDSEGLQGLGRLLGLDPEAAIVVLTGVADDHLGEEAVRAGAQDYLIKGEVGGRMLNRVIRYAVERRRAEEAQRELQAARIYAEENARLERGLLPSPVLSDPVLSVSARCLAGGQHRLLGGDFYDVVEVPDGWVHALIGDVCGRGAAEAALGVCLRVAWRALVLAGRPAEDIFDAVQQVLEHERQDDTMFATLCMVSVAPGRRSARVRLAGHPPPMLVTPGGVTELDAPASPPPGLSRNREWPAREVELGEHWSLLMFTDGLIEGRVGSGYDRLGAEGLIGLLTEALGDSDAKAGMLVDERLLDRVIDDVRGLNGGDLDDDLAVLALSYAPDSHGE